jgi:23S rRNA (adenine2503-C2)-methyltransferase
MTAVKQNIRHLTLEELSKYFAEMGEKKFRTKQVHEWIWKKNAQSFEDMTDLSKDLRNHLSERFDLPELKVNTTQHSSDGTIKSRFMTYDGHMIEGVLIPTEKRNTACISSQVGCSLSCNFVQRALWSRKRNLDYDEIYSQVAFINQQSEKTFDKKLSNVVFMGMGEPLLNYKNVLKAIDKLISNEGLAMSP